MIDHLHHNICILMLAAAITEYDHGNQHLVIQV